MKTMPMLSRWNTVWTLALILTCWAGTAGAEFATVQLWATDDAFCDSANQMTNYGASLNCYVGDRTSQSGGTCLSFFQFDISEVPYNAEILNAELWLRKHEKYGPQDLMLNVDVHLITTPGWDEMAITYTAPPGYTTAASASNNDYHNPPGWDYWNVTADVGGERPSRTQIGWAVKINPLPQWAWLNYYTSEHVPLPDYRPMLEVTYSTVVPSEAASWSEVKALFR